MTNGWGLFSSLCPLCIPETFVYCHATCSADAHTTSGEGRVLHAGCCFPMGIPQLWANLMLPYENSTKYRDKAQRNGFLRLLPLKTRKQKKQIICSIFVFKSRFSIKSWTNHPKSEIPICNYIEMALQIQRQIANMAQSGF